MRTDMCTDMYTDMCTDMRTDMYTDMCTDMRTVDAQPLYGQYCTFGIFVAQCLHRECIDCTGSAPGVHSACTVSAQCLHRDCIGTAQCLHNDCVFSSIHKL